MFDEYYYFVRNNNIHRVSKMTANPAFQIKSVLI